MVQRDLQQNPPLHHPVGTIVTLRIPKKNRNATQNRRLICRILAEPSPGHYQLETEYGTLKKTFPASELDTIAETVEFQVKVPTTQRQITLNYAAKQDRAAPDKSSNVPGNGPSGSAYFPASGHPESLAVLNSVGIPSFYYEPITRCNYGKFLFSKKLNHGKYRYTAIAEVPALPPTAHAFRIAFHVRNIAIKRKRVERVFVETPPLQLAAPGEKLFPPWVLAQAM